jgi:hypothetical protein
MIHKIQRLGTNSSSGPTIYVMPPPPLMHENIPTATYPNETIINSMLPVLVPAIGKLAKLQTKPIDVFTGMGGTPRWRAQIPVEGCTLDTAKTYRPCAWWCDKQACGNCHPNDDGYTNLAKVVLAGLEPLPLPLAAGPTTAAAAGR